MRDRQVEIIDATLGSLIDAVSEAAVVRTGKAPKGLTHWATPMSRVKPSFGSTASFAKGPGGSLCVTDFRTLEAGWSPHLLTADPVQ
jgi:hypothetical protein